MGGRNRRGEERRGEARGQTHTQFTHELAHNSFLPCIELATYVVANVRCGDYCTFVGKGRERHPGYT